MALDTYSFPKSTGNADVFYFQGTSTVSGAVWIPWERPRGKGMIDILLVGKGGNGGGGVISAVSTAAGGGGGGSGGQTRLTMPLQLLPDYLYLSLAGVSTTNNVNSYITVGLKLTAGAGAPTANDVLMIANGGANGSSGSGGTFGGGGNGGSVATAATMPLGFAYATVLVGQGGTNGGSTANGSNLTLPITGLLVTGGTGGAGLGSAVSAGSAGGNITGAGVFPTLAGGTGGATATTPPSNGAGGQRPIAGLIYGYGGTGGGSTNGAATGDGLVQASGGNGAPGCGGGGQPGALIGSTAGSIGLGGPAFCVITVW